MKDGVDIYGNGKTVRRGWGTYQDFSLENVKFDMPNGDVD